MQRNKHIHRVKPSQTDILTGVQQDDRIKAQTELTSYYHPLLLLYKLTPKATQTHKQTAAQLSGTQKVK